MVFKGPSHFKQLVRSFCAVLIAACSGAMAQDNGELAFCAEGERFYPDGQIVEVGDRFFRICGKSFAHPPKTTNSFVNINQQARLDKATAERFPDLRYTGYIQDSQATRSGRIYRRYHEKLGEIELGGLTYEVLGTEADAKRLDQPVAIGSLQDGPLLHFPGNTESDTPPHYLFCSDDPTADPLPDPIFCLFSVRYRKSAYLFFNAHISYASDFPFARPPFDYVGRLGWQARGMEFVAGLMDVTDQLHDHPNVPIARLER